MQAAHAHERRCIIQVIANFINKFNTVHENILLYDTEHAGIKKHRLPVI